MIPFEASVSLPEMENSLPEKLLSVPPASATIKAPAAISQGLSFNSQKPSSLPLAT
jgi:hypothetical protein